MRAISAATRAGRPGPSWVLPPDWPAPTWMPFLAELSIPATNRPRSCGGSDADREHRREDAAHAEPGHDQGYQEDEPRRVRLSDERDPAHPGTEQDQLGH